MADESKQNKSRSGNRNKNRSRNRNRKKGPKTADTQQAAPKRVGPDPADNVEIPEPRKYGVLFFETTQAFKDSIDKIATKASEFDQLNVVIRQEADMDDPEFLNIEKVKVFAGTAWALIHDRRIEDGWYQSIQ